MDTITDQIKKILNVETIPDPIGKEYDAFDTGGVECETGEFLYGLVRLYRPKRVLELGVYTGISSSYIGSALKSNNKGVLDAIEYEKKWLDIAKEKWTKLEVNSFIEEHLISSLDFQPKEKYQIILSDTEPQIRFMEVVRYYPYLEDGGIILVHDLPPSMTQGNVNPDHPEIPSWPFGNIPDKIRRWVIDGDLLPIHLPAPRGLVLFYKSKKEDYKI